MTALIIIAIVMAFIVCLDTAQILRARGAKRMFGLGPVGWGLVSALPLGGFLVYLMVRVLAHEDPKNAFGH